MAKDESYKALQFYDIKERVEQYGLLRVIWGTDVFIEEVPMLKTFLLANIIVWLILFR